MSREIITRKEAQARGLVLYYTGKPCKHGHMSERYIISGICKGCDRVKKSRIRDAASEKFGVRDAQRHDFGDDYRGWVEYRVFKSGHKARQSKKWWYPKEEGETYKDQARRLVREGVAPLYKPDGGEWDITGEASDDSLSFHHWPEEPEDVEWVRWRLNHLLNNATLSEVKEIHDWYEAHELRRKR